MDDPTTAAIMRIVFGLGAPNSINSTRRAPITNIRFAITSDVSENHLLNQLFVIAGIQNQDTNLPRKFPSRLVH